MKAGGRSVSLLRVLGTWAGRSRKAAAHSATPRTASFQPSSPNGRRPLRSMRQGQKSTAASR